VSLQQRDQRMVLLRFLLDITGQVRLAGMQQRRVIGKHRRDLATVIVPP